MAPFFKSSSLFSIARRRLNAKEEMLPSPPPEIRSRSLPNMQALHVIPSWFVEEFHPILQCKTGEQSTPQGATCINHISSPELVLISKNNSPKPGGRCAPHVEFSGCSVTPVITPENNSPRLNEEFTRESFDVALFSPEPVLTLENNSPKLDEQYTPCVRSYNDSVATSEPDEQSTPRVGPSNNSVPTFQLDEQSIPCAEFFNDSVSYSELDKHKHSTLRVGSSISSFELDEHSTPRVGSSNDSVSSFELEEQSTPRAVASVPSPEPVLPSVDVMFKSSAPKAAMKRQFIAVHVPAHVMPLAIKRGALTRKVFSRTSVNESTWSNLENAKLLEELNDLGHIFRIPEGAHVPVKTISVPSDVSLCDHDSIIISLEKRLAETKDLKERFKGELEELWGDYNELNSVYHDLKSEYQIERMKNVKLTQSAVSVKHDAFRLLNKQEWEISQMKRFIAAMVDIKLHTPVLYNASEAIQNGSSADAALIDAIKSAAEKADSPWSAIMPAIVGERPQELYLSAVKRSAKLCGELHESNKKYKWWKMKAQMNPKHANCITPSPSSVSLVLNAIMPEPKVVQTDCADNLLDRLKAGIPIAIVTPVIVGSSKFRDAESDIPTSPASIAVLSSGDISHPPVSSSKIYSSPQSAAGIIAQSPEISGYSISDRDEPGSTIRPYVPGRVLFGDDGLGRTPAGLFDTNDSDELPDLPILSDGVSLESSSLVYAPSQSLGQGGVIHSNGFSNSQGSLCLEYVDENNDSGFVDASSPYSGKNPTVGATHQPPESSKRFSPDRFDEIPLDGRCNPVLRDSDSDDSLVAIKKEDVAPEPTLQIDEKAKDDLESNPQVAERSKDPSFVQSASKISITSLKRLTASSSKFRQSISNGLERLHRISFGSKKGQTLKTTPEISDPMTLHRHHRMSSASGKENRPPPAKSTGSNNTPTSSRPATSIPTRRLRRPTVSSALKTVQVTPPNRSQIPQSRAQKKKNRASCEFPIVARSPVGKRVPLSNIPVPITNAQKPSTHRKVLDKGRKAVRTITKLIA